MSEEKTGSTEKPEAKPATPVVRETGASHTTLVDLQLLIVQQQNAIEKIEKGMTAFERRMLVATWAAVVVAVLTGFVLFAQLYIAQKQAKAAQDSVEAIQRQMRRDQRA